MASKASEYNLQKLGDALRARRKAAGKTQLALSREIGGGVKENNVSRWENGRDTISDVNLEKFALNCGCRGSEILEDVLS